MKITTLKEFKTHIREDHTEEFKTHIREDHTEEFKEAFLFVFNFIKNKKPIPKETQNKINNLKLEEKNDLYDFIRFALFGDEEDYEFYNQFYYDFEYYVSEALDGEYTDELNHIIEFSSEVLNSCKYDNSFNLQEPMFFIDRILVNFNAKNIINFININSSN